MEERIMKKCYFLLICSIFLSICLLGCEKKITSDISAQDIEVGIIETRGNKEKSRIIFYDKEIQKIGELPLKFATVGDIFYTPLVSDEELYVIPQGYANAKDEKKVLEISLQNLEINEYKIDQIAMNGLATDTEFIYTCNNLNGNSYINRCNKQNNVIKTIEVPDIYISTILYANNELYAFGTSGTASAYLYIYNNELKLIDKLDISLCGTNQYKAIEYQNDIYFTSLRDNKDSPTNTVNIFNRQNRSIETIQLNQTYPLDIAIYDNYLFVSHFDIVQRAGGGLSIYNLKTKELSDYKLEHGAEQMGVANNRIYFLADWKIYLYDIENMNLIKCTEIDSMDNDFSYLSGMFVIEE